MLGLVELNWLSNEYADEFLIIMLSVHEDVILIPSWMSCKSMRECEV